jgi:hypothetical protein
MVALLKTDDVQTQKILADFVALHGIKTNWYESEAELEDELEEISDAALYALMTEEPREVVDVNEFLQTLKNRVNASRSY